MNGPTCPPGLERMRTSARAQVMPAHSANAATRIRIHVMPSTFDAVIKHDSEKWTPVFGKDHAQKVSGYCPRQGQARPETPASAKLAMPLWQAKAVRSSRIAV